MFSILPDLAPRDSHSLWYTSSRNPLASSTSSLLSAFDPSSSSTSPEGLITTNSQTSNVIPGTTTGSIHVHGHNSRNASRNIQVAIIERSLLGRLRADETYMERRKANVSNLGSTWLKPLGVSKTLFQMREEERERQEHEEAMRREEMLAGELAEARKRLLLLLLLLPPVVGRGNTNRISGGADDGDMELMGGDDDMDEMGGRDLDEDIPDADEGGFGYDGASDDDDEEDEQEEGENDQAEEEEEEEEAITERNTTTGDHGNDDEDTVEAPQAASTATGTGSSILHPRGRNDNSNIHQQQQQQRELANVRANEERMREMMARGGLRPTHVNLADDAADEDDDIDEEDQAHMLEEDDIIGTHNSGEYADEDGGMTDDSLGMNANLDDDIPEADEERAQSGFYEHTDSEAELLDSSANEGGQEQVGTGAGIGISSSGNGGNMSGSHRRAHRVSYGPGSAAGSAQGQHRRVSLPRQQQQQQQQQQQRLLRTSLAGNARRSTIGAPRSSLDISGLLSVDESSPMMRSSPRVRRLH
ncbi:Apc15p protein-domain-containing protein [Neurospora crassa]|nr:Apc15p protein-domain-containing protein [Neurospora crassa]